MTDTREDLKERIRAAGLRATQGRIAVYAALLEADRPLTHNDLAERVAWLSIDKATIYRNLVDLANVGLLRRSDLGDHTWRFEVPHDSDSDFGHPHFVCVECGDIQCLSGLALSVSRVSSLPRSVRKNAVELQVRGLCDDCG